MAVMRRFPNVVPADRKSSSRRMPEPSCERLLSKMGPGIRRDQDATFDPALFDPSSTSEEAAFSKAIGRGTEINNTGFKSAIYEGWVRHRRYTPHPHAFRYRICMLFVDLAEIDRVFAERLFWSVGRRNLAEFRRSDFLGDPAIPLDVAVRDKVEADTGHRPAGSIRLLTHLRYFGYSFNPVSLYYCYAADGITLDTIVAEITNTPWKQRHAYVLPLAGADAHGSVHGWRFDKCFHVSPFMPMQRQYDWRFDAPGEALRVNMAVYDGEQKNFDATLALQRRELTGANLARVLIRYPLMTMQVVAAIHWQALRLWLRGNPVHDHPNNRDHGSKP